VVVIRRTFNESAPSGTALLECVVKDLPSGEVCINFQANQADISDFTCVDWVASENMLSLTTHFTIPSEHQKEGNSFTCKVHIPFKNFKSKAVGNFFGRERTFLNTSVTLYQKMSSLLTFVNAIT